MSKFDWSKIQSDKEKVISSSQAIGIMSEDRCMLVVEKIQNTMKLSTKEEAMLYIAGLCQRGGTNKNIGGAVSFQIEDKSLTVGVFQRVCFETGKGTTRQFARGMAQEIYEAATILGEEGDLARQMRMDYPNMTIEETIWCSNFQGMNPNCPETVRKWLIADQKRRFQ